LAAQTLLERVWSIPSGLAGNEVSFAPVIEQKKREKVVAKKPVELSPQNDTLTVARQNNKPKLYVAAKKPTAKPYAYDGGLTGQVLTRIDDLPWGGHVAWGDGGGVGGIPLQFEIGLEQVGRVVNVTPATEIEIGGITEPPANVAGQPVLQYTRTNNAGVASWVQAVTSAVVISDTAPVAPTHGMLWWRSDTGKMFLYYDDVTSQQWVQVGGV